MSCLCHLSHLYLIVCISMKEHAYAQLLKWKLSDCRLLHWQLKPKWLTTCIRAPPESRPALRLLDRSCEILLPIDVPCSDVCPGASQISSLTCPLATQTVQLFGRIQLTVYTRYDIIANFGTASPRRTTQSSAAAPLTFSPSSCCCFIIY